MYADPKHCFLIVRPRGVRNNFSLYDQVASYKEVAEHVGLLSGSSSEEEVEDITDFDQGDSLIKQPWIVEPIFIHLCPSRLAVQCAHGPAD